jgi:hypothetical protein
MLLIEDRGAISSGVGRRGVRSIYQIRYVPSHCPASADRGKPQDAELAQP